MSLPILRVRDADGNMQEVPALIGPKGRGISSITGNDDGSWTICYDDGTTETVSNDAYQALKNDIGNLSDLETSDKSSLVAAINEARAAGGSGGSTGEATYMQVGTLPYTIDSAGLYLYSDTDAQITSEGANDLIDLTLGSQQFGGPTDVLLEGNTVTYTKGAQNTGVSFRLITGADAAKTYTLFANIKIDGAISDDRLGYVRVLGSDSAASFAGTTVYGQISGDGYLQFTPTTSNINVQCTIASGSVFSAEFYLYEGAYTSKPATSAAFTIAAKQYTNVDGFIGTTLESTANVGVYQSSDVSAGASSIIAFGDSIFDYSDVLDRYQSLSGNVVLDMAVGGTRLSGSRDSSSEYYPYDMAQIVDAIVSGDYSAQISGGKNPNYSVLAAANFSQFGTLILEYGTNDFTAPAVIEGSGKETVQGALTYILTQLLTAYPALQIVVCSTLPFVGTAEDMSSYRSDGYTVWQMNEIIKSVCEGFSIPFFDMYHNAGINDLTRSTLTSDGVHLSSPLGAKRYANVLRGFLDGVLPGSG